MADNIIYKNKRLIIDFSFENEFTWGEVSEELELINKALAGMYPEKVNNNILKYYETESKKEVLSYYLNECKSPIEQMLCIELIKRKSEIDILDLEHNYIEIIPQYKIDKYTVDFLISCKYVIECDGHDFHQKTKEQVSKDKQRERFLQNEGMFVIRFTGSEIYKNSSKCVDEIISIIKQHEGVN